MKPSPLFTDTFRYFFMRFRKEESIRKWFLKKAGENSLAFSYPESFRHFKKTLIFLPETKELALPYLENFKKCWSKENVLFVARDSLREVLIHHPLAKALFLTEKEFRFGEPAFENIEKQISEFNPDFCIYLAAPFLPALYLAKRSSAPCRVGFQCESLYPFLNISLQVSSEPEKISLLQKQYGVQNANQ